MASEVRNPMPKISAAMRYGLSRITCTALAPVVLIYFCGTPGAHVMALQKKHEIAYAVLLAPCPGYHVDARRADALNFAQSLLVQCR